MKLRSLPLVALPVVAIALVAPSASASTDGSRGVSSDGSPAVLLAGTGTGVATAVGGVEAGSETDVVTAPTATFKVTYHNFSPAAKASFQRAVNTWGRTITSSVPITVDATYRPLDDGFLGFANAGAYHTGFSGAPKPNVAYPDALANKLHGSQLDADVPDIVTSFSSSYDNWHFGTTKAPVGTYDFQTVVTHELAHGLGFLGFGRLATDDTGSLRVEGRTTAYDRYVESAAGRRLTTFADPSAALGKQIIGQALFFRSGAFGGVTSSGKAKLYAPAEYRPGSSYVHLDEATYPQGNPNSLMTPQFNDGETVRVPGAITKAIFTTIGW